MCVELRSKSFSQATHNGLLDLVVEVLRPPLRRRHGHGHRVPAPEPDARLTQRDRRASATHPVLRPNALRLRRRHLDDPAPRRRHGLPPRRIDGGALLASPAPLHVRCPRTVSRGSKAAPCSYCCSWPSAPLLSTATHAGIFQNLRAASVPFVAALPSTAPVAVDVATPAVGQRHRRSDCARRGRDCRRGRHRQHQPSRR